MRYIAYYLVEPKPGLVDRLRAEVDDVLADAMLEPELLANEQGGRSLWGSTEYHLKMKLLWLARFREYEPFASNEAAHRILGTAELSEAAFDAGWTIRQITFSGESKEFIDELKSLLHLTEPTGNDIVDAWLDTLR